MTARPAHSSLDGAPSWLGLGSCILGAAAVFVWMPNSLWGHFLPSSASKLYPPIFTAAFAAGWTVGFVRLHTDQHEEDGAIRSQASITGLLTALVGCFLAYTASNGPQGASLPFLAVAAFFALGLLPCAMFATIGAGFAYRAKRREPLLSGAWVERERVAALIASAILPAVAVLVWPAVYGVGKFLEKPPVALAPTPVVVVAPGPSVPRYVKPEGFDATNAWKRIVTHEETIPNVIEKSPFVFSHDERRLAFVMHDRGEFRLAIRQLYDPGPDRSLPLRGGIIALAWSPDDKRIIFLASESGAFWVCEPETGKMIPLPIPVLDPNEYHGLVWWKDESVVVFGKPGETGLLSLDSLRITSANEVPDWTKLTEDERDRIGREAFVPTMDRTEKVKFTFVGGTGDDLRALALVDDESLYARFAARADRNLAGAFPNRDGSMIFVVESQRLRILYMGLRQSPQLRFVGEASKDFPTSAIVSAALTKRAIRAAVAAPIVNPLNGKTVAGNSAQIKGYARLISASAKTCTVWIEQERQPIREGDVLIALSAIQDGDEFSVDRDWWAILTKADENQSIPRRDDVPILLPSPTRELRPLPKVEGRDIVAAASPKSPTVAAPPASMSLDSPLDSKGMPVDLYDSEWCRKFVTEHFVKIARKDLDGAIGDYARAVKTEAGLETRDMLAERLRSTWNYWLEPETILGDLDIKRTGNSQFNISFETRRIMPSVSRGFLQHDYSNQIQVDLTPDGRKITIHIAKPPQPTRPAK